MKNKKGHQNVSDLKRKIKSLQDQVTTQGEMIHNMADQISELMCARKRDESGMAKLTNSSTAEVDIDTICGVVRRMQKDVSEMKDQHVKCKNVHKTIDELGALCAAAMVAAGTKLDKEIAERQDTGKNELRGPKVRHAEAELDGNTQGAEEAQDIRAKGQSSGIVS